MATLKIYNDIVDEEEKIMMQWWGMPEGVCFKDIDDFVASLPEDDDKIDIHLHCRGGSCMEGWAMYDALRTSGKEITTTIEGECSSMATIILLAAPKERRFGQKNASMCIHNPHVPYVDLWETCNLTAEDMDKLAAKVQVQAQSLREEQKKILNLYVERTGSNAEELQALMDEDKYVTMDKAIELGFICETLAPNTASKSKKQASKLSNMSKTVNVKASVLDRMLAKLGIKDIEDFKIVDQVITTADGQELTVEREEGDPQVGDTASPDGEFTLDDGTKVVVADGVITEITAPTGDEGDGDGDGEGEGNDEKDQRIAELEAKVTELEAQVADLTTEKENLKGEKEALATEKETLQSEKDALTAEAKTEDDKAILAKVEELGGMEWLNLATKAAGSTFTPQNRKFVERKPDKKEEPAEKIGAGYLEAKRAARKNK